jgi:hypothetical protein
MANNKICKNCKYWDWVARSEQWDDDIGECFKRAPLPFLISLKKLETTQPKTFIAVHPQTFWFNRCGEWRKNKKRMRKKDTR